MVRGADRNKPCECGSGVKQKKCPCKQPKLTEKQITRHERKHADNMKLLQLLALTDICHLGRGLIR